MGEYSMERTPTRYGRGVRSMFLGGVLNAVLEALIISIVEHLNSDHRELNAMYTQQDYINNVFDGFRCHCLVNFIC